MSSRKLSLASRSSRVLRKALVSGFVLASYLAYAAHERFAAPAPDVAALPPATQSDQAAPPSPTEQPAAPTAAPDATSTSLAAAPSRAAVALPPSPQPSPTTAARAVQKAPAPTAVPPVASGSQYKNGTFTGATASAFYGQVQVQVVIDSGKIASVTFLNYPQDRRTSVRINSFAVPRLQSEALQAQSARVNIISGATLTSEAFMASLQSALNSARG